MVSLTAVLLTLGAAYIALLLWVSHKDYDRFEVIGPLLMVRTQAGKKLIDRLAKRKWWGRVGDVFIALTVLSGVLMVVLVVWQNTLLFTHTEAVRQNPPQVEQTLAIPGINPVIPVGYGLFSLVVALVIHEGGHGVMARFAHLKVKSLGLLLLVVPIGAFVEPDEHELQGSSLRDKLRMFASGPGPNIVLGTICVLLFAQVFVPAMAPSHAGIAMMDVSEGLPADQAGIEPGDFVTHVNGTEVTTGEEFSTVLNNTRAGEEIAIRTWRDGQTETHQVTPTDKYEWYQENAPSLARDWMKGKAFLGVNPAGPDQLASIPDNLQHPFENMGLQGGLFYLALPFINLAPFPSAFHDVFTVTGVLGGLGGGFWVIANSLYWLFWLNIVLGTFNALPMGPLDGGHMFRHTAHWMYRRREDIRESDLRVLPAEDGSPKFIGRTPEVQERLDDVDRSVSLLNRVVGFGLLALILAPLIIPNFL